MPTMMVSPRDFVLRTRAGHTIAFTAGTPTTVPDNVVAEAMAVNILPTDSVEADGMAKQYMAMPAIPATLRDALLHSVIQQLVKENDSANFNAGGQPKLGVVNQLSGVRISGSELSKQWDKYREIVATNAPVPTHPNLALVQELQTLTTRKQLLDYAADIGFPADEVRRKTTVKEAKEALLHATLNYQAPLTPPPETATLVEAD